VGNEAQLHRSTGRDAHIAGLQRGRPFFGRPVADCCIDAHDVGRDGFRVDEGRGDAVQALGELLCRAISSARRSTMLSSATMPAAASMPAWRRLPPSMRRKPRARAMNSLVPQSSEPTGALKPFETQNVTLSV